MKCPICNLTLADPPNGEEEGCRNALAFGISTRQDLTSLDCDRDQPQSDNTPPTPEKVTRIPASAPLVIDNAVIALSGGIKL